MPGNAAVKNTARAALKGLWLQAIACTFLLLGVGFTAVYAVSVFMSVLGSAAQIVSALFIVLFTFGVAAPLFFGVLRFFWRATAGSEDSVLSVFYYFTDMPRFISCLAFSCSLIVRLAFIALGSFLPYIVIETVISVPSDLISEQLRMHLMLTSSVFGVLGWVFFVLFSVRYYLSPVLFAGCDGLDRHEIIHLSKLCSRHSAGAYLVLIVGMLGWILLSLLGVTLIYTVPYILTAYVIHSRFAINYHNRKARQAENTDFPEFRSNF